MRVVPNLYPAFDGDEPFAVHNLGPVHVEAEASGIHEVLVLSPDHDGGLHRPRRRAHAGRVHVRCCADRLEEHAAPPNVRYTQAIVNHGREAGASLAHPHGQLLGLPFVPGEILDEERAFARFDGGCIAVHHRSRPSSSPAARRVRQRRRRGASARSGAASPYELLIIPPTPVRTCSDASDDSLAAIGRAIRDAIALLQGCARRRRLQPRVPHRAAPAHAAQYHWHVHIWPKLVTRPASSAAPA